MRKNLKRYVSLFTLIAFTLSQFSSLGYAQPSEIPAQAAYFDFKIPSHLGTVEKVFSGKGPALIHIQTAHGNYEAQKSIEALLQLLKRDYGIKTVFVEGSAFELHSERLNFFPDNPKLNRDVADQLTRQALVKGPELFLLNNQDVKAYGIENAETYGKALTDGSAEGILLYPEVNRHLNMAYSMHGHRIRVCSVNLADEWHGIRDRLCELLES